MGLSSTNTIVKTVILVALFSIATSATFADAEVHPDGTNLMATPPPPYPSHWGPPPLRQTRDYIKLPDPYGRGSSTLKKWIEENMAKDAAAAADEGVERRFADPSSWPEKNLVGMTGEEAKIEVTSVDPTLHIEILPQDAMVTEDYREDRVRIFVDPEGKVARQPIIS